MWRSSSFPSRDGVESAVAEIKASGGTARALEADFRDAVQARGLAARAADFRGGLGVLVNNAGITMNEPFRETTLEQYDTVFNMNIRAMFFATQGAAEIMVKAGSDGLWFHCAPAESSSTRTADAPSTVPVATRTAT